MTARVISRSDEDSSASYELAASGATHEQIRCKCRYSSFVAVTVRCYCRAMHNSSVLRMKSTALSVIGMAVLCIGARAGAADAADHSVVLSHDPLIMRISKDEFRIAFGINGERCGTQGCRGLIHYRVDWKTPDGTIRSEIRHVNYTVSPNASRTIAVDRQYFDTAEGQHTTDVLKVSVDAITCL